MQHTLHCSLIDEFFGGDWKEIKTQIELKKYLYL